MIETKEQYDHLWVQIAKANLDATAFGETIEALRDTLKFAIRRYDIDGDALDELLDGLPGWLTE